MITDKLLAQFQKGKKHAFDEIYQSYASGMYVICMRYTGNDEDAKDVLQDTFIKVYQNRHKYDVTKPIGAWIKTITINTAINFLRERSKLQSDDFANVEDQIEDEEVELYGKDHMRILLDALAKLPDGYRTVFNLYAIENLTHNEIAEHLEISVGTSKSQYSKAKRMLKELIVGAKVA